jgi:hypothetical protein
MGVAMTQRTALARIPLDDGNVTRSPRVPVPDIDALRRQLERATDPGVVKAIEDRLSAFERLMLAGGLYRDDEIRSVNETRMRARWKLGRLLAKIDPSSRCCRHPAHG